MNPDEPPVVTDLSSIPAEEWPAYFFDLPVLEGSLIDNFEEESYVVIEDGEKALVALTELLLSFGRIGQTYSLAQINQGVWAMWSFDYELQGLLWNEDLPWDLREKAIEAMLVPFRDYVAGHPAPVMENGFWMWWDLIEEHEMHGKSGVRLGLEEDRVRVRDAYLQTLKDILALDDGRCQQAALHGLGHLNHPARPAVVQAYIDAQTELHRYPEGRRWLEECRDGTVM